MNNLQKNLIRLRRGKMGNTCSECRFFTSENKCAKFSVNVIKEDIACNDFAEKTKLTENAQKKMQLND